MRTALCISGQTRTLEKSFPMLKEKVIDRFQPDVFVSTWETSINLASQYKAHFGDKLKLFESHFWDDKSNEIFDSGPANNASPMFYKIWRADLLRQEYQESKGFKYDLVIRSRTDLKFEGEIQQDKVDMALTNKNIVCGDSDCPHRADWICDTFAFGDSIGMANYASTWWELKSLRESGININEIILLANLRRKGVKLIVSDFSKFGYTIIR